MSDAQRFHSPKAPDEITHSVLPIQQLGPRERGEGGGGVGRLLSLTMMAVIQTLPFYFFGPLVSAPVQKQPTTQSPESLLFAV